MSSDWTLKAWNYYSELRNPRRSKGQIASGTEQARADMATNPSNWGLNWIQQASLIGRMKQKENVHRRVGEHANR